MNLPIIGDSLLPMWDARLAIDMFLGGAGAAAFALAVVVALMAGWDRSQYILRVAGIFAPLAVAISLLLLLSELTQPGRFLLPYFSGEALSPLMWGAWIQTLFLVFSAIFAVGAMGWAKMSEGSMKTLGVLGAVFGITVTIYHGVYLSDNAARALWGIGGLPLLFPIVALATGAAALVLAAALSGDKEAQAGTGTISTVMVASGIGLVVGAALYLYALYSAGSEAQEGAALLMSGSFAAATWIGVFAAGILGVIAGWAGLRSTTVGARGEAAAGATLPAVAALLILVAGFVLKYIIVAGGQTIPQLPIT